MKSHATLGDVAQNLYTIHNVTTQTLCDMEDKLERHLRIRSICEKLLRGALSP